VVKNVVALGAFQAATGLFPEETFRAVLRQTLKPDEKIQTLNQEAFTRGWQAAREQLASSTN